MRAPALLGAAILAAGIAVAAPPASAQPADVAAQIKLIENQPAELDRTSWKDKRRDAARRLAQSKDRRAVAELIKLAETETFDIIGEIAIEGLGKIGDPAAIPTLQKIAADPSRDPAQRELARKALGRLGAEARSSSPSSTSSTTGPTSTTGPGSPGSPTGRATAGEPPATSTGPARGAGAVPPETGTSGAGLVGATSASAGPGPGGLPAIEDDVLAAYERVTFAGGTANLGYDTVRKRVDFDADVAGQYQKRVERERMAWGWDAGAHVVAGYINPDGPAVTRGLQLDLTADGEARLYAGRFYGIGRAAGATQVNYVSDVDPNNASNTLKDTRFTADLQLAVGGGYGRVVDLGAAIRVRRLARTLEAGHALGRPIDPGTARRLQLTWWALRGERSTYRALVATVAILREAGVLLAEPDAGLSYELLNVLRDSQLLRRPSGLDVQVALGEGYLQRPGQPPATEHGRVEQLLASATYGAQLDDDQLELSGGGYARLRLLAPDDQPSPWAVGATGRVRRFAYGAHGDPLGALDVSGTLQLSDDDLSNSQVGQRLSGQLGFTWWVNAASAVRVAASVGEDRGALFLGAELTATYGLLDGTFAR